MNEPLLEVEIVAGAADETEMTALVAASLAVAAGTQPPPGPRATPTGEWVLRARCAAAGSPFPGARSRTWRWSLHP